MIPEYCGGLTRCLRYPYDLPLWEPYQLAFFGLLFFLFLSFVSRPRTCIRRVDRDEDDEGKNDRRDYPREQDQQGHYFG